MLPRPQVLAQLSKVPLNGAHEIRAADVYSLVGTEKKKRTELMVAIDQEGIQIFDVRLLKLVTSYAVPAQSLFTCPPFSLRRKQNGAVQRLTYLSLDDLRPRIQCFVETSGKNVKNEDRIKSFSRELSEKSRVKLIDIYSRSGQVELELLAIHENGVIRSLSEDLSTEHWTMNAIPNVVYAEVCTVDQAKQGLLKARQDVVALIGSDAGANVLILLTRTNTGAEIDCTTLELKVFKFSLSRHDLDDQKISSNSGSPEEVLSVKIPQSPFVQLQCPKYTLHKATGSLYEYRDNTIAIYNLSELTPRLERLTQLDPGCKSSIRISSTTAAYTTATSIFVMDTQYSSIQASGSLDNLAETAPHSSETDEAMRQAIPDTDLLSYYASLEVIVAMQNRNLVTFQVGEIGLGDEPARKRIKRGTLADAVGRGLATQNAQDRIDECTIVASGLNDSSHASNLDRKWESKLSKSAQKLNGERFDKDVRKGLNINLPDTYASKHILPTQIAKDQSKIYYILSKLFRLHRKENITSSIPHLSLSLEFLPPNTFRWLAYTDYMTLYHIEIALKRNQTLHLTEKLHACALIEALAEFDKSLQTLLYGLTAPLSLTAREHVYAIRLALQVLEQSHNLATLKLIENGDPASGTSSDDEMVLTNGDLDNDSNSPEKGADRVHDAQAVLRTCFTKLSAFHDSDIRKAFKQEFTTAETMSFIHHSRTELAGSGWFLRDKQGLDLEDDPRDFPNQIVVFAKLLNCAIDVLGSGAWLFGKPGSSNLDMDTGAATVRFMQSEISAALLSIEESAYLQGLLREFLTYSNTSPKPGDDHGQENGLVRDVQIGGAFDETNALPLGLRSPNHVDKTVNKLDGTVKKRSAREIAHLKRMKVGAYSLDKIYI